MTFFFSPEDMKAQADFSRGQIDDILFFPRRHDLTFHINHITKTYLYNLDP